MQNSIVDLNEELVKLATRDEMWDVIETKLNNHVKSISDRCGELEESVSSSKPTVMGVGLQRYLAGNCQRIAKLVATKADFVVIQQMITHKNPVEVDWDEEVNKFREEYKNDFLRIIKEATHIKHPITDFSITEARNMFMTRLDLAIKVAISKYARVQIGTTILGRRQLVPTCMACDRPFNSNGTPSKKEGDLRGATMDTLPNFDDDDSSIGSLGSLESGVVSGGGGIGGGGNVGTFGMNNKKMDRFVFRAGFKIPKRVSTPLIVASNSMGNINVGGRGDMLSGGGNDGGGRYNIKNTNNNSAGNGNNNQEDFFANRPHTVAFDEVSMGSMGSMGSMSMGSGHGGGGGGGGGGRKMGKKFVNNNNNYNAAENSALPGLNSPTRMY